jgi:hypothetical protein
MSKIDSTALPSLSDLQQAIGAALVLHAESARFMLGVTKRGQAAADAYLGAPFDSDGLITESFVNNAILPVIDDTEFARVVGDCFSFASTRPAVETIDIENFEIDAFDWLDYFWGVIPHRDEGAYDVTSSTWPLYTLLKIAGARLELLRFVMRLFKPYEKGLPDSNFTPEKIAILAGIDLRSARNAMGPRGNQPIKTGRIADPEKKLILVGDPLDTVEWLAERRGFFQGPISTSWINANFSTVSNKESAAALPGIAAWLNRISTADLAEKLDWKLSDIKKWFRGKGLSASRASEIAAAAGLDGALYAETVTRLLKK